MNALKIVLPTIMVLVATAVLIHSGMPRSVSPYEALNAQEADGRGAPIADGLEQRQILYGGNPTDKVIEEVGERVVRQHDIAITPEEAAAFRIGYIAPQKARVLASVGDRYEDILSKIPPVTRKGLTNSQTDIAWALAVAYVEEEACRLEALEHVLAKVMMRDLRRVGCEVFGDAINVGSVTWTPPEGSPVDKPLSLSYRIYEGDYTAYTDAWRRRGVVRAQWERVMPNGK